MAMNCTVPYGTACPTGVVITYLVLPWVICRCLSLSPSPSPSRNLLSKLNWYWLLIGWQIQNNSISTANFDNRLGLGLGHLQMIPGIMVFFYVMNEAVINVNQSFELRISLKMVRHVLCVWADFVTVWPWLDAWYKINEIASKTEGASSRAGELSLYKQRGLTFVTILAIFRLFKVDVWKLRSIHFELKSQLGTFDQQIM